MTTLRPPTAARRSAYASRARWAVPLCDGRLRARARFALARVLVGSLGAAVLVVAGRLVGGAPDAVNAFAPAQSSPEATAFPTQPRRPTRTPAATATPSPTPIAAAALRADVWIDPPLPVVGETVRLGIDLQNRDRAAALDVTLDVTLPAAFVDATLDVEPGETARAGALVRWHIARLESGARASLRVGGQATRATGPAPDDRWCVLLLSYGSPVEHCMRFEAVASEGAQPGSMGMPESTGEPLPAAPTGLGLGDMGSGSTLAGWVVVALGLVILGLWTGATMRARPNAEPGAESGADPKVDPKVDPDPNAHPNADPSAQESHDGQ